MMLDVRQIEYSDGAFLVRLRDLRDLKALEQQYPWPLRKHRLRRVYR